MTDARGPRGRGRPRHALGAVAMTVAAAIHPGCSCSDDTTPGDTTTTTTTTTGGGMGGAGGMGGGGMGGAGGAQAYGLQEVTAAQAFDVTPSPDGGTLYFTGVSPSGTAGVFRALLSSGDVDPIATGGSFIAPLGIAASADGTRLFVTDAAAMDATGNDAGQILLVGVGTGSVVPVSGGEGTVPRGIETYLAAPGDERLVFTGVDPADRQVGVFDLPASGGTPEPVFKGAPLVDPSGVAIASDGRIFVCDTRGGLGEGGAVFVIEEGVANPVLTGLRASYPCGIALSRDDTRLLVSTRNALTGASEVLVADLPSASVTALTPPADPTNEPAGLHRAKDIDVFSFADSKVDGTGLLFVIRPQP